MANLETILCTELAFVTSDVQSVYRVKLQVISAAYKIK